MQKYDKITELSYCTGTVPYDRIKISFLNVHSKYKYVPYRIKKLFEKRKSLL